MENNLAWSGIAAIRSAEGMGTCRKKPILQPMPRSRSNAANGMDVLAFGLSAYTRLDGMITTNTSDLNTYLAHSADYEQITVSTVPVQTAE